MKLLNIFKKKEGKDKNPFGGTGNKWWEGLKADFRKDTGFDETDPEYTAQNIYKHWLKSYVSK